MKKAVLSLIVLFIISCDANDVNGPTLQVDTGLGGSLARFALYNEYLYVVDSNTLSVFNIQEEENPVKINSVPIDFNIETLFSYRDYLYIGSQNGMFIYSVDNPETPGLLSSVEHFTACDPVIANDQYAFVTLHSDIGCGNTVNRLEIYDITDVLNPLLISNRNLTKPIGIGLYGNYLFVCDDEVKVFDVSDATNAEFVTSINRDAFDVIISGDLMILIGDGGLYQYRLNSEDINSIENLSALFI